MATASALLLRVFICIFFVLVSSNATTRPSVQHDAPTIIAVDDRQSPLAILESELAAAHSRYQHERHSRLLSMDTRHGTYVDLRERMRDFFTALSATPQRDEPLHLSNINELRHDGYRFAHNVDPGLHTPFGTRWSFRAHGPYPATRLAQGGFASVIPDARLSVELDNGRRALDRQNLLDVGAGSAEYRGLMAYTDDVELLRSAIEYHERRLGEQLERGRQGLRKVIRVA